MSEVYGGSGGKLQACREVDRRDDKQRAWVSEAIRIVDADANRSADTHLHVFPMPEVVGVDLYLKDESVHPTGSLKHRLARSLFLYALCNGWIREGTTVIEASSGSTAVSEAYFARLLGLPFVAVMPASTSPEKIGLIEFYGGRCHFVERSGQIYGEAKRLAEETGGHYMDQFTYAERATDWRGNNNIAESIFGQLALEQHPIPTWIVNLRVSKMGGLLRSLRLLRSIRERGVGLIVGAHVGETSILTRAALTVANCARDILVAQEGAFGTHLLNIDVADPPLMFGVGGVIDIDKLGTAGISGLGLDIRSRQGN